MDEPKLNSEDISLIKSCLGCVRKARVAVIRKAIKKMKILKTCKNETLKDKKLRKSERIFEKIQIMKKLKDEEVLKFALHNPELEKYFKDSKIELKENALASLSKHDAVSNKIKTIRERIPNWEQELPLLLESLKKDKVKQKKTTVEKLPQKEDNNGAENATEVERLNEESGETKEEPVKEMEKAEIIEKKEILLGKKDSFKSEKRKFREPVQKGNKSKVLRENSESKRKKKEFKKIDDPFFIEKKVIAPKLFVANEGKNFQRDYSQSTFNTKPFRAKDTSKFNRNRGDFSRNKGDFRRNDFQQSRSDSRPKLDRKEEEGNLGRKEEESTGTKLHPSWAAKKVQLIKPFQGKKITFSQD